MQQIPVTHDHCNAILIGLFAVILDNYLLMMSAILANHENFNCFLKEKPTFQRRTAHLYGNLLLLNTKEISFEAILRNLIG